MTSPLSVPDISPNRPLRLGLIGCGQFTRQVRLHRLSGVPNVSICAISDPDASAMRQLIEVLPARMWSHGGDVATYADYKDLLAGEELDAVCINSPNKWHVPQLLASLDRGLHVLCEKPLSMVPDEVSQVVAATQKAGRVVAIGYQSRYRKGARILRSALQSGKWGRITSVNVYNNEDWITPNVGTWRHDPARCPGGFFADANGHQLDSMFWMTGLKASWVRATWEGRGTPVPIVTWGEARLIPQSEDRDARAGEREGIPFAFMFVGDAHHWREEIAVTTERADFAIRSGQLLWAKNNEALGPFPESEIDPAVNALPDTPDSAFIAALRGGPPIVSPPETVWPVLKFTLGALASADAGGVPLAT